MAYDIDLPIPTPPYSFSFQPCFDGWENCLHVNHQDDNLVACIYKFHHQELGSQPTYGVVDCHWFQHNTVGTLSEAKRLAVKLHQNLIYNWDFDVRSIF